ncbi:MAG: esterase family protein [bacterium]|nr:esterase family protein [bacterium]
MALIDCKFYSEILELSTAMTVILPEPSERDLRKGKVRKLPVLFLLHGRSDDHTAWVRRTSIERYLKKRRLAVVMPDVHRSYYTDMAHGYRYWTHVSEEVPAMARALFPLSDAREDTFVAGLSMGGYGAFKLALRHPDRFAAAASLSGALDVVTSLRRAEGENRREMERVFGSLQDLEGSDNDLLHLAAKMGARRRGPVPRLFQCCGTEDFLYEHNQTFRSHAATAGLDVHYEEGPGSHEWGYWDTNIQRVLDWLPFK